MGSSEANMKITLSPTTKLGKWSIGLCIAFLILMVIVFMSVIFSAKDEISENFFEPLWPAVTLLIAGACEMIASVLGVVSIIKNKERSILVFFAVGVGLFALFFLIGELLFPH